jgi:hypothetical protein
MKELYRCLILAIIFLFFYFFICSYYKMNMLMLVVVALVALCYFGGNYCPAVLRQNKKMLLGGAIALVLCSFFGMQLEGFGNATDCTEQCVEGVYDAAAGKKVAGGSNQPTVSQFCDEYDMVSLNGQKCEYTPAPVILPVIVPGGL